MESDPKSSGTYRAAMAAVIILSGLLVLGLLGVVAGFVHQYRLLHQGQTVEDKAPASDLPATLQLAPGTHIVSASTDSGKLVLHLATPEGGAVEVIDLATGQVTARVKDGK